MTAPEVVKFLRKPPLWDSEYVNQCSTNIDGATKSPRLNSSTSVYVPFVREIVQVYQWGGGTYPEYNEEEASKCSELGLVHGRHHGDNKSSGATGGDQT